MWMGPLTGVVVAVLGFLAGPAPAAEEDAAVQARVLALNKLTGSNPVNAEYKALLESPKEAKKILAAAKALVKEKKAPLTYNAAFILANLADALKDLPAAETFYRVCIDKATRLKSGQMVWQSYISLIALHFDNQQYAACTKVCREFLDLSFDDPKEPLYLQFNDDDEKERDPLVFESYNPIERDKPKVHRLMIQAIAKQGKFDEATKLVNNLVKARPRNWQDLQLKGWVLREAGKYKEASKIYEDVLERIAKDKELDEEERDPLQEKYRYTLSNIYAELKQIDKSTEYLKALLEKKPNNPTYNNDLGYIWADNDMNLEEAEKLIRKALAEDQKLRKKAKVKPEDDRDNGAYLDSLGWVLFKQKKYKEARVYLLKAIGDKDSRHIEIYDHLGDVYTALGEKAKAVEAWEKGLKYVTPSKRDRDRKVSVEKKIKAAK
jgi:tetratricopeptide (TPR) repeat protein